MTRRKETVRDNDDILLQKVTPSCIETLSSEELLCKGKWMQKRLTSFRKTPKEK